MLTGDLPCFQKPQKRPATEQDRLLVMEKLEKVRRRGYIAEGPVRSLTHFFYVPKGDSDIRMVYNGTSSGLNNDLYAPHFGLPVIRHALRSLLPGYNRVNIDIAEMFLNFNLGPELQPYSGVDLTPLLKSKSFSKTLGAMDQELHGDARLVVLLDSNDDNCKVHCIRRSQRQR